MGKFSAGEEALLKAHGRHFKPQAMVSWLHPLELLRSGARHLLTKLFGAYADRRELQAALDSASTVFSKTSKQELWIDYLADTGDGFDSTFTIATALSSDIRVPGVHHPLRSGDLLLLGGDQVYPNASHSAYRHRFRMPFVHAPSPNNRRPSPDILAIPGNHDWYDGLTSFLRLFGQQRPIGHRSTSQRRSYFAIELANDTWIWGVDAQLDADMDDPQRRYFVDVAKRMPDGSRVLLLVPEPSWVKDDRDPRPSRMLHWFLQAHLDPTRHDLVAVVAGDIHAYARYSVDERRGAHWVMCGGGGACLHGTQAFPQSAPTPEGNTVALETRYPSTERSRRLSWGCLLLPFRNISFTWLLGGIYFLLAWVLVSSSQGDQLRSSLATLPISHANFDDALLSAGRTALLSPGAMLLLSALLCSLYLFADWGSRVTKLLAGLLHAAGHILLCVVLLWASLRVGMRTSGTSDHAVSTLLFTAQLVVLGGFLGGHLVGVYLFLSSLFGRHINEVFVSQSIPHYKSFLRLHLLEDGRLDMYALGIDRVTTKWRVQPPDSSGRMIFPRQDPATVHLIEGPIELCPARQEKPQ